MKKIYKKPTIKVYHILSTSILCCSSDTKDHLFEDEADDEYGMD